MHTNKNQFHGGLTSDGLLLSRRRLMKILGGLGITSFANTVTAFPLSRHTPIHSLADIFPDRDTLQVLHCVPRIGFDGAPINNFPVIPSGKPTDPDHFFRSVIEFSILKKQMVSPTQLRIEGRCRVLEHLRKDHFPTTHFLLTFNATKSSIVPKLIVELQLGEEKSKEEFGLLQRKPGRVSIVNRNPTEGYLAVLQNTIPLATIQANLGRNLVILDGDSGISYQLESSNPPKQNHVLNLVQFHVLENDRHSYHFYCRQSNSLVTQASKHTIPIEVEMVERQVWSPNSRWIWTRMERRNAKGDITEICDTCIDDDWWNRRFSGEE